MNKSDTVPSNSSEATRARLIEAGLHLFAEFGVEGVRTRVLAETAGVNQSAIPYHFGGKEGVYRAVIDEITREIAEGLAQTGLLMSSPNEISNTTEEECENSLRSLIHAFTLIILSPGRAIDRTALIVREQLKPTENFNTLFKGFIEPLHTTISATVARLNNTQADDPVTIIKTHALIGQVLSFIVAQQTFLTRIQGVQLTQQSVQEIASVISNMSLTAAKSDRPKEIFPS
ncbi:CerR family C-terminal domain-containing protein [Ochrobactrum sp. Marseille-Q0166]|uniref:CerR family C-terminal domain-containing protein n=1 Tax=Ochrobactrum sp. Marseille-Q0166 TaxID=2761105 RepID=UPI0016553487|nr:CerR family C-terminal domain-containing protein [Ochrobactrum sp. Marseille-Q0166]MBC8719977.1 CerR family C-terminal domain-containing protein [Ochrobactrum sp. Marseille-Q0166]